MFQPASFLQLFFAHANWTARAAGKRITAPKKSARQNPEPDFNFKA
jgi:hypothetical protein